MIESVPFNLHELFDELVGRLMPKAHEKGLQLTLNYPSAAHRVVLGDPIQIRQVAENLVGNALKFTLTGSVMIEVSCADQADGEVLFTVAVRDTGIGISPEDQTRLFEHFTQVDSSSTRRFGGTGLGLAISKRIVGLMGGQVGFRSEL